MVLIVVLHMKLPDNVLLQTLLRLPHYPMAYARMLL